MTNQERITIPVKETGETHSGRIPRDPAERPDEMSAPVTESLGESLRELKMKVNGAGGTLLNKARKNWNATNDYVCKNPWMAVGVSVGFAFPAGMMIGRRRGA